MSASAWSGGQQEASTLGKMVKQAEVERAKKNQVMVEAREIKHKEMERLRKEEDDGGSKTSKLDSLKSTMRRGSDANPTDTRELRSQISKLENKYKEAMLTNAQLDSEKQILRYEVDLLKDKLEDLTDDLQTLQKAFNNKKRESSYQKMQIEDLKRRVEWQHSQIEARDQLITEQGLVLVGAGQEPESGGVLSNGGSAGDEESPEGSRTPQGEKSTSNFRGMALLSKETAELLGTLPTGDLESRLREIMSDNDQLKRKIEQLENRVEEEKSRADLANKYDSCRNGVDTESELKQKLQQSKTQAQEYKLQLQKSNQKISSLETEIIRFEGQVKRYKSIADASEKKEEELKLEKRKLQKDFRDAQSGIEDLKSENSTLQRKLDKLKSKNV